MLETAKGCTFNIDRGPIEVVMSSDNSLIFARGHRRFDFDEFSFIFEFQSFFLGFSPSLLYGVWALGGGDNGFLHGRYRAGKHDARNHKDIT